MKLRARMNLARRSRRWACGQTYVEFMMLVLPTLLLVFGIISLAMTIYTYSFLSDAARDAVRYAIVHGSKSASPADSDDIQTYVRDEAQGLKASAISVSTTWNPNNNPGSTVNVQVSYSFHPLYPFANVTLPLSSSSQMVISY
ncbi:MAG TPA: TadE/TadG family type IV pilus assembly protein [Candidatus Binataceae bacterium]|nr:TadE/TadG family type IV pilus assembly protein [Candidatus Binataceae bacterium]